MESEATANPDLRTTNIVASAFAAAALVAVLLTAFVMASRPWGCSATSESPTVTCDWTTSRVIAGVWLLAGLVISLIAWKRWTLPLAILSPVLLAVGLVSVIGVYVLAPAALWFASALWLWAQGRQYRMVVSGVATIALLYLVMNGLIASLVLYFTPV